MDPSHRRQFIARWFAIMRSLAYPSVGAWLEEKAEAPPERSPGSPDLAAQLKLQDEAAQILCDRRHNLGALDFDRMETGSDGHRRPRSVRLQPGSGAVRAWLRIEDFMIAANEVMARTYLPLPGVRRFGGLLKLQSAGRVSSNWRRAMGRNFRKNRILAP